MPGISNAGMPPASFISSSTSLWSSSPARKRLAETSRASLPLEAPTSASSSAFLGARFGLRLDIAALGGAHLGDADFEKIAHDLFDVAADIADFGEFGRLDLEERRLRELRQPARDLGLADAGRPDHQDVLGQHFLAQFRSKLLAAPAVAQARWRPRAWRHAGRRCSGRVRKRFRAA